jgi:hypothetical protein
LPRAAIRGSPDRDFRICDAKRLATSYRLSVSTLPAISTLKIAESGSRNRRKIHRVRVRALLLAHVRACVLRTDNDPCFFAGHPELYGERGIVSTAS